MSKATRIVEVVVESTHRFEIPDTNSDEEAISIAEAMLAEDDYDGEVSEFEILSSEIVDEKDEVVN